jgi:hypothetical protein
MAQNIRIEFRKARDYRLIPVTGVWGGRTAQGEIIFDMTVEKRENPMSVTLELEKGKPPKEIAREGEVIVRESQIGIVLRPDIALSIGKWLIEKAKEAGVTIIEGSEANA